MAVIRTMRSRDAQALHDGLGFHIGLSPLRAEEGMGGAPPERRIKAVQAL